MKNKKFENLYINALKNLKLEGVVDTLKNQKAIQNSNKLVNFLVGIKNKLIKKEISNINLLTDQQDNEHDLSINLLNEAIKEKRIDVVLYLIENKYYINVLSDIYFSNLVKDYDILKGVLDNKKIEIKQNDYLRMLKECIFKSNIECFKLLLSYEHNMIKIDLLDKQKLLMETIYKKENNFFNFLVKDNEFLKSFNFNLETEHYGITQEPDNILLASARLKNYELLEKIIKEEEKFKVKVEDSIGWILSYNHKEEIMDEIIIKNKYSLTENLEKFLILFKEEKYIEIFKKRDLLISLEEKLEIKHQKRKKNKI